MSRFPMRWSPLATVAGLLLAAGALTGCPGSLDPGLMGEPPSTGSGGTSGTGGSMGTGGGSGPDCSGDNDGATIVTGQCAMICHSTANNGTIGGGLDLTVDGNIKSRLVGMKSPSNAQGGSLCAGNGTPYLNANSNPATGLLIDKVQKTKPQCGDQMPQGTALPSNQQQCLIKWVTTLTTGTQ